MSTDITKKTTPAKKEEKVADKTIEKKPVKEAAAKKISVKKAAAPKKAADNKDVNNSIVYVQYEGREVIAKELLDAAKKDWIGKGNKEEDIKKCELYIKPEEAIAYYVINSTERGHIVY